MSDKDLIAEARAAMDYRDDTGWFWVGRLADAFEAQLAARQPSGDDREAAFESGMEMVDWGMVRDGVGDPQDAAGIAVRAALEARAAVSDAATEQAKEELAACLELRVYWRSKAVEARAERDAALAAIERVRAINTGNNRALYGNDFEAGMAKALWLVKAALDGAPEPEEKP